MKENKDENNEEKGFDNDKLKKRLEELSNILENLDNKKICNKNKVNESKDFKMRLDTEANNSNFNNLKPVVNSNISHIKKFEIAKNLKIQSEKNIDNIDNLANITNLARQDYINSEQRQTTDSSNVYFDAKGAIGSSNEKNNFDYFQHQTKTDLLDEFKQNYGKDSDNQMDISELNILETGIMLILIFYLKF